MGPPTRAGVARVGVDVCLRCLSSKESALAAEVRSSRANFNLSMINRILIRVNQR
jgi:hypothetical protein